MDDNKILQQNMENIPVDDSNNSNDSDFDDEAKLPQELLDD